MKKFLIMTHLWQDRYLSGWKFCRGGAPTFRNSCIGLFLPTTFGSIFFIHLFIQLHMLFNPSFVDHLPFSRTKDIPIRYLNENPLISLKCLHKFTFSVRSLSSFLSLQSMIGWHLIPVKEYKVQGVAIESFMKISWWCIREPSIRLTAIWKDDDCAAEIVSIKQLGFRKCQDTVL